MTFTIRNRKQTDTSQLVEIFEQSILAIDEAVYSKAQKRAWMTVDAGLTLSVDFWSDCFTRTQPLVAENESGKVVGFIEYLYNQNQLGEYDPLSSYIAGLFVHPGYQRQGIAQVLYDKRVINSYSMSINTIWVHASKLAHPFFLKQGFKVVEQQAVKRDNITLPRYLMRKSI